MHFLGLAGMPRRIPGKRLVFVFKNDNDYSSHSKQSDKTNLKSNPLKVSLKNELDKLKSIGGKPFGQCTRTGYEVPYARFPATKISGSFSGIVDRKVTTKVHVSQCPKGDNFSKNVAGGRFSPYCSIYQKTGRAFIKSGDLLGSKIRRYSTFYQDVNYEDLTKGECGNRFETVELWLKASNAFEAKVQPYLEDKDHGKCFLSDKKLEQEANGLVLNYYWLVSKILRERQETLTDERVISHNIPHELEKLQCVFLESCAARYHAV